MNGVTVINDDFGPGIPFAEPPIGQLRLAPPVCMKELPSGKFDASKYGAACLQPVRRFLLSASSIN